MDFQELIRNRYATCAYQSRAIEPETLERVLNAFVLAPAAANRQLFGLIVVETQGNQEACTASIALAGSLIRPSDN